MEADDVHEPGGGEHADEHPGEAVGAERAALEKGAKHREAHERRDDDELDENVDDNERQLHQHRLVLQRTAVSLALLHRKHDCKQRPGHHVRQRGARHRERADVEVMQPLLGDDARQHRKGGDAHRGADEQLEGQRRHSLAVHVVVAVVQVRPQRKGAKEEGQRHGEERNQAGQAACALQFHHIHLKSDDEHKHYYAELRAHVQVVADVVWPALVRRVRRKENESRVAFVARGAVGVSRRRRGAAGGAGVREAHGARTKQDAGDDLAYHSRLAKGCSDKRVSTMSACRAPRSSRATHP